MRQANRGWQLFCPNRANKAKGLNATQQASFSVRLECFLSLVDWVETLKHLGHGIAYFLLALVYVVISFFPALWNAIREVTGLPEKQRRALAKDFSGLRGAFRNVVVVEMENCRQEDMAANGGVHRDPPLGRKLQIVFLAYGYALWCTVMVFFFVMLPLMGENYLSWCDDAWNSISGSFADSHSSSGSSSDKERRRSKRQAEKKRYFKNI